MRRRNRVHLDLLTNSIRLLMMKIETEEEGCMKATLAICHLISKQGEIADLITWGTVAFTEMINLLTKQFAKNQHQIMSHL